MTLTLRPRGRGNWQVVEISIAQSRHSPLPLEFHVGQLLDLGGRCFRVVRITE
ncbi:hypothetical protein [Caldimonas sp. KR1-144]|uniref:hypothetical protein n=1 Tax=Caldimonas sp. KR1-144 TaxID=3400911 RepID=UPI003C0DBB90